MAQGIRLRHVKTSLSVTRDRLHPRQERIVQVSAMPHYPCTVGSVVLPIDVCGNASLAFARAGQRFITFDMLPTMSPVTPAPCHVGSQDAVTERRLP